MESVKAVLACLLALGESVDEAKANDGKFTWTDLLLLGRPLKAFPAAFAEAKNAEKEWKASTPEQRAEVTKWIADNFKVKHAKTEKHVEAALAIVINLSVFFQN